MVVFICEISDEISSSDLKGHTIIVSIDRTGCRSDKADGNCGPWRHRAGDTGRGIRERHLAILTRVEERRQVLVEGDACGVSGRCIIYKVEGIVDAAIIGRWFGRRDCVPSSAGFLLEGLAFVSYRGVGAHGK